MMQWARSSKFGLFVAALVVAVIIAIAMLQGCSMGELITVRVPSEVRTALKTPSTITYNTFEYTYEEWMQFCERGTQKFVDAGEDAAGLFKFFSAMIDTGIGFGAGALESSGIPGGTILASGLALLGGLFMKQPGTDSAVAKAKEDSFNAGMRKAATIANRNGGTA